MPEQPKIQYYPAPRTLREILPLWAFGLEGDWLSRHLAGALDRAAAQDPRLAGLAGRLAAWNFERAPLDGAFAARGLVEARQSGEMPKRRMLCAALTRALAIKADHPAWPALRDGPDPAVGQTFLQQAMADPATGLVWHGRAFRYALARGLPQLAQRVIAALAAAPRWAPIATRLAAEAAFAWDGPQAGLAALKALDPQLFPRFQTLATAHGLAETGQTDAAVTRLVRLWRTENWHPGLTLRLHALLRPLPPVNLDALPGRLFVFLYTWNRAGLLRVTLDSLAASRLGPARVVVLDNGGTDDTAAVCRAAADGFGPDRFTVWRLPVNIGAPAARNWLAAVSELGEHDLAAYVDDDVVLPAHWLETLVAALLGDPQADAAGARIVSGAPGAPALSQSADVRLLPPDAANTVRPLLNHGPGPDFGLLATVRPSASVSGCCHLLRGQALSHNAPFDIRFSPSQFDDLARDLRGFLAGRRTVYAGTLAVSHHQHASAAQARTSAAVGQLAGARVKLDGLFSRSEMETAARRDASLAWAELEAKWRDIRETLGPVSLNPTCTAED